MKKLTKEQMIKLKEFTNIEFKDDKAEKVWANYVGKNQDSISKGVINYADRWMKCMQYYIFQGASVAESAQMSECDADFEGMSGFSFGWALSVIAEVWKYGDELAEWHNAKFNYKGKDVVNPAILTIKTDDEKTL